MEAAATPGVNLVSLGICIVVSTALEGIIGAMWYGPLFAKTFCKLAFPREPNPTLKNPPGALASSVIFAALRNIMLAYFLTLVNVDAAHQLFTLVLLVWFVGSSFTLVNFLFEERPWQLWALHAGHHAACLMLNCSVLGIYMLR